MLSRSIFTFCTWILLWNIFDTSAFSIVTTPSQQRSVPYSAPLTLDPIFVPTTVHSSNTPVTAKRRFILRVTSKSVDNEKKIEDNAKGTRFTFENLKWWKKEIPAEVEIESFSTGLASLFRLPFMAADRKIAATTKSIDNLHCNYDHRRRATERPSRIRLLSHGRRVRHRFKPSLSWS